jgi:signal peptidase I
MKLASVLLVLWAVFTFVFALHIMKGESMYPRLRDGDLYLSYRLVQDYDIDDVVSFEQNGMVRTARVVAQGGDVVDLTDNGQLIINGHIEQEEIFYVTLPDTASDVTYPYTVEEGSYFLLCDFRTGSSDSRTYGAFSQDVIEGKVISVFRHRGI